MVLSECSDLGDFGSGDFGNFDRIGDVNSNGDFGDGIDGPLLGVSMARPSRDDVRVPVKLDWPLFCSISDSCLAIDRGMGAAFGLRSGFVGFLTPPFLVLLLVAFLIT